MVDTAQVARSVSQVKSYEECGYRYYLERRAGAWQRPAAWFGQGTAVHAAAEKIHTDRLDEAGALEVFGEVYAEEINEALADTPNMDLWFASGPYRGEADIERRFGKGREQVSTYYDWAANAPPDLIWITPDGTPAIELGFNFDLDGVPVRGYIDAVWSDPAVVDLKTGLQPGDAFQLATYGVALADVYGLEVDTGYYWMAAKGKPTRAYDLTEWPRSRVSERFAAADEGIRAERWEPNPGKRCARCSVATACPFVAA